MNDDGSRPSTGSERCAAGSTDKPLWIPIPELDWDDEAAIEAWCRQIWELAIDRWGQE